MTDNIPSTIEFYMITPRIRRLFAEVWATIPENERFYLEGHLFCVEAGRHREYHDDEPLKAGHSPPDGTIELYQWKLKSDDWARYVIAHELAHTFLHENIDSAKYHLCTEYYSQIEAEADQKAKAWGYERPWFILSSGTPTPEEAAKIHWRKVS